MAGSRFDVPGHEAQPKQPSFVAFHPEIKNDLPSMFDFGVLKSGLEAAVNLDDGVVRHSDPCHKINSGGHKYKKIYKPSTTIPP